MSSGAGAAGAKDQVARLLTLVPYLRARGEVRLDEAAAALGVTAEQLLKDLKVLWMCGTPGGMPDDLIDVDVAALEPEDGDGIRTDGIIRVSVVATGIDHALVESSELSSTEQRISEVAERLRAEARARVAQSQSATTFRGAAQAEPVRQAVAPAAPAPAPVSSGPKTGPNRLVVRTEGEAWIEIRDSLDRMLVSSLNPPGSERVVRGRPPYTLVIGNASNVRVTYDDKPIDLAPHTRQDVARLTVP